MSDSGIPSAQEIHYIRDLVEEKAIHIRQLFDEKLKSVRIQIDERDKALNHQFEENERHFERLNHAAQARELDRGELISRRDHDHVHVALNDKMEALFKESNEKMDARLKPIEVVMAEARGEVRGKADKATANWALALGGLGAVLALGSMVINLVKLFVH